MGISIIILVALYVNWSWRRAQRDAEIADAFEADMHRWIENGMQGAPPPYPYEGYHLWNRN